MSVFINATHVLIDLSGYRPFKNHVYELQTSVCADAIMDTILSCHRQSSISALVNISRENLSLAEAIYGVEMWLKNHYKIKLMVVNFDYYNLCGGSSDVLIDCSEYECQKWKNEKNGTAILIDSGESPWRLRQDAKEHAPLDPDVICRVHKIKPSADLQHEIKNILNFSV